MDFEISEQIEDLLSVWYSWQRRQSAAIIGAHNYRSADATCRAYQSQSNADEDAEAAYQWADDKQSEQVQLCIDRLTFDQRAAISNSLRNKEVGYSVWRNRGAETTAEWHYMYQSAKADLLPLLLARHLVKAAVPA